MKLLSKIIIFVCVMAVTCFAVVSVRADSSNPQSSEYVFHLYLNAQDQLVVDKIAKFSYDIVSAPFVQASVGQFPYRGEVINFRGTISANFKFNVQSGAVTAQAPYIADGQKAVFYDSQNQPALTISVSGSSFCNDDGICNADRGEDSLSCPLDCKQSLPTTSIAPVGPVQSADTSSTLLTSILYLVGGLVLAGIGWWFFKRSRQGPTNLPPSAPILPTPPTPLPILPPTPSESQNRGSSISQSSASSGEKSGQLPNNPV